jgi:hypothetical protein
MKTVLQKEVSDPAAHRWIFKATIYKTPGSKGFVGYGDADPSNVSSRSRCRDARCGNAGCQSGAAQGLWHRAVFCRGVGLAYRSSGSAREPKQSVKPPQQNGSSNGQPRLRDQLCLLIRRHNLDPTLVKAFAADFWGTETLNGASRDLVEPFISHLAASAKENRDGLVCKLNSYAKPVESKP